MPTHNIYVPVTHTIMPRPKLRDYDKEDQLGTDFTYRTRESHTHARAKVAPNTLKPVGFSPIVESNELENSRYAHSNYGIPLGKFKKDRRLSKSRREAHKTVRIPLTWRFSTTIGLSEEQEAKAMEEFNQRTNVTQGLSMTIDKSPFSLWGAFASIIFTPKLN